MHTGENPAFDRARVAADPTYNLATGTQILAAKWKATNCVGDNQPTIIEHWYTATWAYNGLAYVNNPSNPNYSSNRGVWNPANGERHLIKRRCLAGWSTRKATGRIRRSLIPRPATAGSGSPGALPEPSCSSPTNCVNHRTTHVTICKDAVGTTSSSGAGGGGGGGGGGGSEVTSSGAGGSEATAASVTSGVASAVER